MQGLRHDMHLLVQPRTGQIGDVHDDVRLRGLLQGRAECLHEMVGQLADEAYCVGQQDLLPVGHPRDAGRGVQGVEQPVHRAHARPGEGVEQRGFSRVRIADQGYHGPQPALSPVTQKLTVRLSLRELSFQGCDPPADPSPVCFQLFFAGTSGPDSAAQTRHGFSRPGKSAQPVLELRQLHLQPSFLCPCPHGKDIQDQQGAVHDLAAEGVGQLAQLYRGQFVVTDDPVRLAGVQQRFDLQKLAASHVGDRIWPLEALQDAPRRLGAGGFCQFLQLVQGLGRLLSEASGYANQNEPLRLSADGLFHPRSFPLSGSSGSHIPSCPPRPRDTAR